MFSYLGDTSNMPATAECVYIPQNQDELCDCLKRLVNQNTAITLSAGRTGTTGGGVPQGGALISVELLNSIITINQEEKYIEAQAGVTLDEIEQKTNPLGLSLRVLPTEQLARLGGVVSTCASGVRGFGYGSIRNYVRKLQVLMTTGDILDIERGKFTSQGRHFDFVYKKRSYSFDVPSYNLPAVKSQAGYFVHDNMDLIDLFIGSEGTLGVILSAGLSLQQLPFALFDGLVFFKDEADAFCLVEKVKSARCAKSLSPAALEFFDERSLRLLAQQYSFVPKVSCAIYFQQEAKNSEHLDYCWQKWQQLLDESQALMDESILGDTARERKKIFEFRHKLPQMINEFLRSHNQLKVSSDIAVPEAQLQKMYHFYKRKAEETGVDYVNFGHIGESHLHFNFLPKSHDEYIRATSCMRVFCREAVSLGGTVSAEHGIGKLKKDYLKMMYSKEHIQAMACLKKYFDPYCLLGLDTLFEKELLRKC